MTETTEKKCIALATSIKAQYKVDTQDKTVNSKVKRDKAAKNITLRQAIDKYIESRDNVLSPSTVRGYTKIRDLRFAGVIDDKLDDIRDWQAVCNAESALCSAKTLKNAWGLIGSVLRYNGRAAPIVTLPQVVAKDLPWLEPEQISAFMDAIYGDICEIHILLALHGLRRSEVCALTSWDKIDLKKRLLTISGAVVYGKDGKRVKKDTNKNVSSRRVVPIIIPRLLHLLKQTKKAEGQIRDYHPDTIYKHVAKACATCGLPNVGIQGLRRSFASLCYHLKLSERETMELGGWEDPATMRKIYIHLAKRDKLNAQKKLTGFFKLANGNANGAK